MTATIAIEDEVQALRAELKLWEREFAAQHHGRKAAREDVKANRPIGRFSSLIRPLSFFFFANRNGEDCRTECRL
jgi:DNA replication and checkpoint protein